MGAFEYTALDAGGRERKGILEGDTRAPGAPAAARAAAAAGHRHRSRAEGSQARSARSRCCRRVSRRRPLALHPPARHPRPRRPAARGIAARRLAADREAAGAEHHPGRALARDGRPHARRRPSADFPRVFPEIYRATVSAGEQSGHLDNVLERLADYTESREADPAEGARRDALPDRAHRHVLRHRLAACSCTWCRKWSRSSRPARRSCRSSRGC